MIGTRGVGESLAGGVSAFSNAVIGAFVHLGATHLLMPHAAARLCGVCHDHGLTDPALAAE